jgi:hypothetical protein
MVSPLLEPWLLPRLLLAGIRFVCGPISRQLLNSEYRSEAAGLILLLLAAISILEAFVSYVFGLLRLTLLILFVSLVGAGLLDLWFVRDVPHQERLADEPGQRVEAWVEKHDVGPVQH